MVETLEHTLMDAADYEQRAACHRARLEPIVGPHLKRRSQHEKHPVWDFLFEYYSFRPSQLTKWSPGWNAEIRGLPKTFPGWKEMSVQSDVVALDLVKFPFHRIGAVQEILEILEATQARPAYHGCFGLHEWAMVYRSEGTRHPVPLRFSEVELAAFVESQMVRCTHYDAFRFFTPAARSLNVLNPTNEDRAAFEQPGCIHANMDLYKWAYKFYPWIGSDLIAEAFEVAANARYLDMRAAPYDLSDWGVEPIRIETAEGRREYGILQRQISEEAIPVRQSLMDAYRSLFNALNFRG